MPLWWSRGERDRRSRPTSGRFLEVARIPAEARRFAERFRQNCTNAEALLPVVGELSLEAGEQAPLIPLPNEGIRSALGR